MALPLDGHTRPVQAPLPLGEGGGEGSPSCERRLEPPSPSPEGRENSCASDPLSWRICPRWGRVRVKVSRRSLASCAGRFPVTKAVPANGAHEGPSIQAMQRHTPNVLTWLRLRDSPSTKCSIGLPPSSLPYEELGFCSAGMRCGGSCVVGRSERAGASRLHHHRATTERRWP